MREGDVVAGKYKLIQRLGEGGEGSVFLAIHLQTEMFRAIKEIRVNPDADDTFFCHELQMMKRLKMEHLPEMVDVLRQEDTVFLVMEHVRGIPLNRRIRNAQVLEESEVFDVAWQVTEALCYLEKLDPPVCHLDIKPSNLILRPDGLIKLVDFGSAWKEKEQIRRMGTEGYAAPEQYLADGSKIDVRTDIFGLGATLYRLSSGKNWSSRVRVSCVPNCTPRMSDLILRCLREDPAERFQSAACLKDELKKIRKRERLQRGRIQVLGALAIALPAAALCLRILPSSLDLSADESWNYEKLIREAGVVSEKESREYYRKAVFMEPRRGDAYLRFLSDAQTDGTLSKEEELFLRDVLHSVRPGSDQTFEELLAGNPEAYLETALQIALAYWYNSPREDSRRIAMGWFEKAVEAAEHAGARTSGSARTNGSGASAEEMEDSEAGSAGAAAGEVERQLEKQVKTAALYLRLGTVLEKIRSGPGEETGQSAVSYWEELNNILKMDQMDGIMEDPMIRLKLCRESLQTLTFLSGDLARAGIGKTEQIGMIETMEDLAEGVTIPAAGREAGERVLEEIRQAASAAREAAEHVSEGEGE